MEQLDDLRRLRRTAKATERLLESVKLVDTDLYANYREQRQGLPIFFAELDVKAIDEAIKKKELMLLRARALREANPMLGRRGVRLGISYPEIYPCRSRQSSRRQQNA